MLLHNIDEMYFIQWLHYIDSNLNAIQVIYQMSSNVIKMLLKEQSSTSIQSKKKRMLRDK